MCSSANELRKLSGWEGKGAISRQRLMDKLQCKFFILIYFKL